MALKKGTVGKMTKKEKFETRERRVRERQLFEAFERAFSSDTQRAHIIGAVAAERTAVNLWDGFVSKLKKGDPKSRPSN